MEDKQELILKELLRRAQEIRFGSIKVEFKIHQGRIEKGDIIEKRETLG